MLLYQRRGTAEPPKLVGIGNGQSNEDYNETEEEKENIIRKKEYYDSIRLARLVRPKVKADPEAPGEKRVTFFFSLIKT